MSNIFSTAFENVDKFIEKSKFKKVYKYKSPIKSLSEIDLIN